MKTHTLLIIKSEINKINNVHIIIITDQLNH